LTYGKKARKDLLDRMRKLREELEARLSEARIDARKRSRAVSKGLMLEHICPYLPTFNHNPRDARFLGDPIDFVIFDGLFAQENVTSLTIAEVKSGSSKLTPMEKSIQRAVERGRVDFEIIKQK
jgi:predicted Holliday junction resolvase-like endonuclease